MYWLVCTRKLLRRLSQTATPAPNTGVAGRQTRMLCETLINLTSQHARIRPITLPSHPTHPTKNVTVRHISWEYSAVPIANACGAQSSPNHQHMCLFAVYECMCVWFFASPTCSGAKRLRWRPFISTLVFCCYRNGGCTARRDWEARISCPFKT